ncbi:hypothetical protein IB286_05860 [Spongiibacter sp. KMU-158]|uniref:YtfJ family protein n=1 Tax=Spongiibacter pelagi TaxID=2760804 RepID=A0A927GVL6_9GAMM|nr:YtfJ family protein [Spongiibacter pelagi]MBD2858530.1 hypothetical protein [Spongiibacter pelagi]
MKQLQKFFLIASLGFSSLSVLALEQGQKLPELAVDNKGEFVLNGDKVDYRPWNSNQITTGRPALVFHLPPRLSTESMINPLRDRLEAENYAEGAFQSVTVINLKEAMWGTSGMILSRLSEDKTKHPSATFVIDDQNRGVKAWDVGARDVVVALVNTEGTITHLHTGELSADDVNTIMSLLNEQIAKADQLAAN